MLTWDKRHRGLDIAKHLLWIALTIVIVTIIAPAFLKRGFSMRWFIGFLPDVAIVVATLVLDDVIQVVLKLWAIIFRTSVL